MPGGHVSALLRGVRVVVAGVRQEPRVFGVAVGASALYGAATAAGGFVLGRITDQVLTPAFAAGSVPPGSLARAGAALAAVAVLTAIGVVGRRAAAGVTMYRLQARYRRAVTQQYLRLPLAWHHQHPTGQLLSNANADVEAIWQVMAPLPMAIGVAVMVFVAAIAMVAADPVLAAVGVLVIPGLLWVNAVYQRRMSPLVTLAQQLRADVSEVAHESFDAATVVKAMGREGGETTRFAASAQDLRAANVAVGRLRGMFDPAIEALPTLGTLAVLAIGTVRVASGEAATGDVIQVAYLLSLLAMPVRAIGWVLGELPRSVVGWDRVDAVLSARGELPHGPRELPAAGPVRLALDDVSYAYVESDGERSRVLHDISLDLAPGRTVAVVGPTGSGKSTLAGLLVRLVDPESGRVLIDGVDLRDVVAGGVAGAVGMVPQNTFIFNDTVADNVTLGADIPAERIWHALRLARAEEFVRALPAGLDTRVGERGTTLSGGQRQRLALARALVREPRLLVLDDATSAVDPVVEAEILAGLRQARAASGAGGSGGTDGHAGATGGTDDHAGATVVVVAYRTATIALADEVVYVEHGRIAARGTHEALIASCEGYRILVTAYERDAAQRGVPSLLRQP
jgi:ABC-type multidrug transport system fused ATPase/permease subunit